MVGEGVLVSAYSPGEFIRFPVERGAGAHRPPLDNMQRRVIAMVEGKSGVSRGIFRPCFVLHSFFAWVGQAWWVEGAVGGVIRLNFVC